MAAVTRLGLYGGSRSLYGDFSSKEAAPVVSDPQVHPPGTSKKLRKQFILLEDELILAVIMAFLHIKDE